MLTPLIKACPLIRTCLIISEIKMRKQTQLIEKFLAVGGIVQNGVWVVTAAEMVADQKAWPDEDLSKETDFTTSEFWLVTDNGVDPIGIDTDQELGILVDL